MSAVPLAAHEWSRVCSLWVAGEAWRLRRKEWPEHAPISSGLAPALNVYARDAGEQGNLDILAVGFEARLANGSGWAHADRERLRTAVRQSDTVTLHAKTFCAFVVAQALAQLPDGPIEVRRSGGLLELRAGGTVAELLSAGDALPGTLDLWDEIADGGASPGKSSPRAKHAIVLADGPLRRQHTKVGKQPRALAEGGKVHEHVDSAYEAALEAGKREALGIHYTPPEVARETVAATLRSLFADHQPTSNFLLSLRVVDASMGGGAFLVEAGRYLADALFEAWEREGVQMDDTDRASFARFVVVRECLYGVDKDPEAHALALASLAAFVGPPWDEYASVGKHLRIGDALVGLSTQEIERGSFDLLVSGHWKKEQPAEVDEIAFASMEQRIAAGDCLVGAFFAHDKPKDREAERARRVEVMRKAFAEESDPGASAQVLAWQKECREIVRPFHWQEEFPELFFDWICPGYPSKIAAFVGNPPYLGGGKIRGHHGPRYLDFLKHHFEDHGAHTDLCAYFLQRIFHLMGRGAMGQVCTNSVSMGDSRPAGLEHIVNHQGRIFAAKVEFAWPGKANVLCSTVWIDRGNLGTYGEEAVPA